MPGDNMIGDYTTAEIQAMTPDRLATVSAEGFKKPQSLDPAFAGVNLGTSVPAPAAVETQPETARTGGWKRRGQKPGYDFTAPSGQKCRLRPLMPEELLLNGLLEQVTRLDGLAQELVNLSSGLPPEVQKMPSREDLAALLDVLNKVTVLAVVEPRVFADGDPEATDDDVYVSDIDITDRIAILNESLKGVKALDNFRQP